MPYYQPNIIQRFNLHSRLIKAGCLYNRSQGMVPEEGGEAPISSDNWIPFPTASQHKEESDKAYPWYSERTRKLQDPILRMHNEVVDFYLFASASDHAHSAHRETYRQLKTAFNTHIPTLRIGAPFLTQRLYLANTELEVFILTQSPSSKVVGELMRLVEGQCGGKCSIMESSQQDKYQLWQVCWQSSEGVDVIIRVLEESEWYEFFYTWEESIGQSLELRYVYMVLACMVRQRNMQNTVRSYLLLGLLSVFYHQRRKHRPRTLTENLLKFLQYYGPGPFQQRKIVLVSKGRYELQQEGPPPTPFAFWIGEKTNIAHPALKDFFALLKNRYRLISNYNFQLEQCILGSLLNPNQTQFSY